MKIVEEYLVLVPAIENLENTPMVVRKAVVVDEGTSVYPSYRWFLDMGNGIYTRMNSHDFFQGIANFKERYGESQ